MPYNPYDDFSTPVVDDIQNRFSNFDIPDAVFNQPVYDAIPALKELNISTLPNTDVKIPKKEEVNKDPFANLGKSLQSLKPTNTQYYDASLETLYQNPNLEFNPTKDMQDIYAKNEGTMGRMSKRINHAWDNAKYTYWSSYIGQGRALNELQELNFDKINNASLDQQEQKDFNLKGEADRLLNPIYLTKEFRADPYSFSNTFSLQGAFGDGIESMGFGLGAMAVGTQDMLVGTGIKALAASGVGNAVLLAGALGTSALFNDDVRNSIGEDNANALIGMVAGGVTSYGINRGFDALFKGGYSTASSLQKMEVASKAMRSGNVREGLKDYLKASADNLAAGTFLDKSDDILNSVKIANTASKTGKGALTLGKMYMSSGGEAGLEAIQAQSEFVKDRLAELGRDPNQEELKKIIRDSKDVGSMVYNTNRALLALTNSVGMGSIISGTVARNLAEKALKEGLITFGKEGYKSTLSVGKEILKQLASNSVMEGVEEGLQFTTSEATKKYIKEEHTLNNWGMAHLEALKETVTSREGLTNIISGMVSGMTQSQIGNVFKGIQTSFNNQGFASGFLGYSKENIEKTVESLNNNRTMFRGLLNDMTTSNLIEKKDDDGNIIPSDYSAIRSHIEGQIAQQTALALNSGTYYKMPEIINDYFEIGEEGSLKKQELLSVYGDEEGILKAKESLLEKMESYKAKHEAMTDYFYNPYTTDMFDDIGLKFKNKKLNTLDLINKVKNKVKKKKTDETTETVAPVELNADQKRLKELKEIQQERQDKKELFDTLVNAASYNLFMYEQHNDRHSKVLGNLKEFFSKSDLWAGVMDKNDSLNPLDYIITGNENGLKLYYDRLTDEETMLTESIKGTENVPLLQGQRLKDEKRLKAIQNIKTKLDSYNNTELLVTDTQDEKTNKTNKFQNKLRNPLIQLLNEVMTTSKLDISSDTKEAVDEWVKDLKISHTNDRNLAKQNVELREEVRKMKPAMSETELDVMVNTIVDMQFDNELVDWNKITEDNYKKYESQKKEIDTFTTLSSVNPDLILVKLRDLQSLHNSTNTFLDDVNKLKSKTEQKTVIEYLYRLRNYQSNAIKTQLVQDYIAPTISQDDDELEDNIKELEKQIKEKNEEIEVNIKETKDLSESLNVSDSSKEIEVIANNLENKADELLNKGVEQSRVERDIIITALLNNDDWSQKKENDIDELFYKKWITTSDGEIYLQLLEQIKSNKPRISEENKQRINELENQLVSLQQELKTSQESLRKLLELRKEKQQKQEENKTKPSLRVLNTDSGDITLNAEC